MVPGQLWINTGVPDKAWLVWEKRLKKVGKLNAQMKVMYVVMHKQQKSTGI